MSDVLQLDLNLSIYCSVMASRSYVSINQTLIPSTSPRIFLHLFKHTDANNVAFQITRQGRQVLGLALQLDLNGRVDALVIAAGPSVYHFRAPPDPLSSSYGALIDVLDGRYGTLCGFNMARMALHLHRDLGVECSGVELGDILPNSGLRLWDPSELVQKRITTKANGSRIDSLWYGSASGDLENTCLRAWLCGQ